MISRGLKSLLSSLDLIDNQAVFFFDKANGDSFEFSSKDIGRKINIIKPTAFYVFNNQPYILFFDLTNSNDAEKEKKIHKQAWSFDQSPLIFIIKDGDVEIYNAFAYDKKQHGLQRIDITKEERDKQFSFWNLQSGATWKWLESGYYEQKRNRDNHQRVNQRLFDNIKEVRKTLMDNGLKEEEANILILRVIFIRYLIDRNINIDNAYISGSTNIEKRSSFLNLLKSEKKVTDFFKYLNDRFNGVLFKDVAVKISKANLDFLTDIFDVRSDKTEPSLFDKFYFDVFDFSIIPVEVISGIYESLMDEETRDLNSAVYTPSFLVDYILTDTVDRYLEDNNTSECRIFDPACGSGIFLVQSLRRMIDKEIELYNAKIKTKKFSQRLREIVKNNLFGVDKSPESLKVSCFSIYIALLDYQEPKDIDVYQFPNLIDENFFCANFFDTSHLFNEVIRKREVNFILGNPPWKNGRNDPQHTKYLKNENLSDVVSDYQLAQSFTIRTKDFSNEDTRCSLVITSKAIYNINAEKFRKFFLEKFYLYKCFDLSPVRRLIFEGADSPAMILQFQFSNEEHTLDNIVLHQSLKYNIYLKHFKALVIEKNDTKKIMQRLFYDNNWMFKVALYGGALDYNFMKRLSETGHTIKSYVTPMKDVYVGDGIKKHSPASLKKLKNSPLPFTEIKNIPIIETKEIKRFYTKVRKTNLPQAADLLVKSGRNIKLYMGDKILFSANLEKETEIVIPYSKGNSVFREKTLGITAPKRQDVLKEVFAICSSKLYTYYEYLIASHWGVYYPYILEKEYLSFPYREFSSRAKEKLISLSDDLILFYEGYYSKDMRPENLAPPTVILEKIDLMIKLFYNLNDCENDLIDYVLNIARYQFQSEKKQKKVTDFTYLDKNHYRNRDTVLKQYANIFLRELKDIYAGEFMQVNIYALNHFIALDFRFLQDPPAEEICFASNTEALNEMQVFNSIAKNISVSQIAKDLFIQKDIKGFEENSFYIIKPNEYKCWHRAMAWYDIAEIKESIQVAELERLHK